MPITDTQILRGCVPLGERRALERAVLEHFFAKAQKQGKKVSVTEDQDAYDGCLQETFAGTRYLLLIGSDGCIADMRPVAYHTLDTKEGCVYAKLMLRG